MGDPSTSGDGSLRPTFRIAGPFMFTRGGMFCTYVLGGQAWDFRSQGDRLVLWDQGTFRWSRLEGRPIKLRSTPMPYPSYEFARSLDEDTPHPLPNVPGAPSWDDYLGYSQRRLQQTGLDTKLVTLSVWIGPNPKQSVQEELIHGDDHPLPETVRVIEQVMKVDKIMTGPRLRRTTDRPAPDGLPDASQPVDGGSGADACRNRWRPLGARRRGRLLLPPGMDL